MEAPVDLPPAEMQASEVQLRHIPSSQERLPL